MSARSHEGPTWPVTEWAEFIVPCQGENLLCRRSARLSPTHPSPTHSRPQINKVSNSAPPPRSARASRALVAPLHSCRARDGILNSALLHISLGGRSLVTRSTPSDQRSSDDVLGGNFTQWGARNLCSWRSSLPSSPHP